MKKQPSHPVLRCRRGIVDGCGYVGNDERPLAATQLPGRDAGACATRIRAAPAHR